MKWLVVMPTVRQGLPGFDETVKGLRESFTLDTDLHVWDGAGGKVPALNRAYDELLTSSDADIYVTIDDDIIPGKGWQDDLAKGFSALDDAGILCPWLGDAEEVKEYIGEDTLDPWAEKGGVRYRLCQAMRHIPGILLAFRRKVALEIGKQPETGLPYDVFEDAWRGRRAFKKGWRSAYIDSQPCNLVTYPDPDEYLQEKRESMEESRKIQSRVMKEAGVDDPLSWKLRRKAAKLLGRVKADPEAPNQKDR